MRKNKSRVLGTNIKICIATGEGVWRLEASDGGTNLQTSIRSLSSILVPECDLLCFLMKCPGTMLDDE